MFVGGDTGRVTLGPGHRFRWSPSDPDERTWGAQIPEYALSEPARWP